MSKASRVPKYRRHKPTGQAVVTLCGKDHYLGTHSMTSSGKARASCCRSDARRT